MANDKLLIKFGEHLRKLREARHLSQEELGFKAEIHRTYIGAIERGEQNVSLINQGRIAKALQIRLKDLFDFS